LRELDFTHKEDDFNAFNRESLIPHILTTEGPPLAVADINGNGFDDFFVGGAKGQPIRYLFKNPMGNSY
jgi:hypothetical protein